MTAVVIALLVGTMIGACGVALLKSKKQKTADLRSGIHLLTWAEWLNWQDGVADALATLDDLRMEMPIDSMERAELDALHTRLDDMAARCVANREVAVHMQESMQRNMM